MKRKFGNLTRTHNSHECVNSARVGVLLERYLSPGEIWISFGECVLFVETVFHSGMIHKEYEDKQQTMLIFGDCTNMPLKQIFLELSA